MDQPEDSDAETNVSRTPDDPASVEEESGDESLPDDPDEVIADGEQWTHPSPDGPDDDPSAPGPAVSSDAIDSQSADEETAPPTLPDALFAGGGDAGEHQVYWYVREDAELLVLANQQLEREGYHTVATSTLGETDGGALEWEIPATLVRGHPAVADVPDAALIDPDHSIHFRASPTMLDGPLRTCYAMTADRLDDLTR